jgi:F0F1-type ATP synthase delta subunit
LQSGISAGSEGRNPTAFKLSQVLQGTEETLLRLGIKYSGDSYQLVSNFGARCSPSIAIDDAYKNAKKYSLQIDEADINKKISYWEYSNNPDSFADSVRKNNQSNPNQSNQQTPNDDWKKQRAYAAKIAWKNNKKYTPDVIYSESHCISPIAPNRGEIVALKYGTGQGKSTKIKSWFANELKDFGAIKLGSRNSLEYQFARSSDFTHLKDDGQTFILDPKGRTTSCIDSILKYDDDHFDGKVLVLDEIESLTRHSLYGGTLKERQQQVIDKFRIALQRCHSIILADGNLSDHVCNFIQKLSGKKLIKYYNDVIPLRPNVTFYDDMDRNFSAKLSHQIKGEAFPWVMLDSQVDCESMDKDLTRYGRKVLRIDSKTINDPILGNETKQFLSNPDLFLLENEVTKTYDVILSTPTVESGLDCNYKGFSGVYLLCKHLEINSLLQMIIRVRDVNCPRYVCAPKYVKQSDDSAIKSPFIKTLSQLEIDLQKKSVEALGSELGMYQDEIKARLIQHINDSYSSPEQDLFNVFNTIKNYEHSRYRECLIESLSQSGYKVTFEQIGKPIMTQFKECKIEVKESVASDVSSADKIDENQYKKLSKRQDLKWLDRCSVTKYRLLERLPGVEGLGWDKDLVFHLLFENKKLISQAEIRWMLSNPELAVKRSQKAWHGVLKYNKTFLGNFKTLLPVVKELNRLDVPKLMDKLTTIYYNSDYPEVKALWDGWGRTQVTRTGIERGGTPVMLIKRLAAKLGYETVESGAIWVNGATVKNYILNDLMSTSQYGIIVAGCVSERLENENLDPGIGDSDWLEILHPESLETIHSMQSIPYKPIHYTIDINDTVCKASNPDTISNTAITNVENQQTTPEPIPELITAQTTTPEPEPEPEPLSWKGATGRIKPEIAPYWLEVYKIYKESNPLTRSGARVKSVDSAPTWKHNAMAPNGGGWMLLVEIEGLIGTKINVPMDCLEFEG